MSKDRYIILDDMPSRGAFTEVWTANGHSCSKSCLHRDGKLMQYEGWDDGDIWIDYEPLNEMQTNPVYIISKA